MPVAQGLNQEPGARFLGLPFLHHIDPPTKCSSNLRCGRREGSWSLGSGFSASHLERRCSVFWEHHIWGPEAAGLPMPPQAIPPIPILLTSLPMLPQQWHPLLQHSGRTLLKQKLGLGFLEWQMMNVLRAWEGLLEGRGFPRTAGL